MVMSLQHFLIVELEKNKKVYKEMLPLGSIKKGKVMKLKKTL
jgi:hypothetical protein